MRISEACRLAGVSTSTLKYYIRERLVPEGERISTNQTRYTEAHVQRAKLARALIETGALSVASARQVLAVLDQNQESLAHVFEAAQHALGAGVSSARGASEGARELLDGVIAARSWCATPDNPGYDLAARALDGLATIDYVPSPEFLSAYADAAATVARADLEELTGRSSPALVAELMVVGTVMGDTLLAGLRRMAQQHETAALFPAEQRNPAEQAKPEEHA